MILDEAAFSDIDDRALMDEIHRIAYSHKDARPAWIGAHLPRTSVDVYDLCGWAKDHYNFYLNFVREYMEPGRAVLDIGCGAGQNTAMLARYSKMAIGIDEDEGAIAFARKHNGPDAIFMTSQFPDSQIDRTFDYIFCVETIEHIPYEKQWEFLDAALGLLKPDGRLFITTPNEEVAAPPHVGIWTRLCYREVAYRYSSNILRHEYFSNKEPQAGFREKESSHHALVMKR